MFQDEDRKNLQTLADNNSIMWETQQTSKLVLNATLTAIKEDKHFWHYQNELVSDVCQKPDQATNTQYTPILQLINNCNSTNDDTKETLKTIIFQHAVKYMRPETGSGNKKNPLLHATYSWSIARHSRHAVNNTRKQKKKDE